MATLNNLNLEGLRREISGFHDSQRKFQVLETLNPKSHNVGPQNLFVLDACFNPPTIAHSSLAAFAFSADHRSFSCSSRLLLLFCTNGTKRAPSPATVEDRVEMIRLLVSELHEQFPGSTNVPVDIALTKETTFVKKSVAIATASQTEFPGLYSEAETQPCKIRQIYLLGSDNFFRVLKPEFYPGYSPPLSALGPLFDNGHEILCSMRPDDFLSSSGSEDIDLSGFEEIVKSKEAFGFKREWMSQVRCIRPSVVATGVSSTAVRKAAKATEWSKVRSMCPPRIFDYIHEHNLYADDDRGLKHAQKLIIGISGCTSSGKTTSTALLRQLLPEHTIFIHGDMFGRPLEDMPLRDGFADCDSRQSVRTDDLCAAIEFTKANGKTPATVQPFEALEKDLNDAKDTIDYKVLQDLRDTIRSVWSRMLHFETIIVVDGFMLYHDETLKNMFDIKLLLRASREESWRRRSIRYGNLSEGDKEFWQTKSYFDACVWYNYELEHRSLFPDGEIQGPVDTKATTSLHGIAIQPEANLSFSDTHRWVVDAIIESVGHKTS
jgi:nicotinamide-nucleotide adenylyltransferase